METKYFILWIVVIVAVITAVAFLPYAPSNVAHAPANGISGQPQGQISENPIATVSYTCDEGKMITASFYSGVSMPPAAPNEPPTPGGSVNILLGDGRAMTLPQTISADGARYANADESFIFWSKGNGVFNIEDRTMTYTNCMQNS